MFEGDRIAMHFVRARPCRKLFMALAVVVLAACGSSESIRVTGSKTAGTLSASVPPEIKELTLLSKGHRMAGLAYLAAGTGPHPTVILLHGYPGNEKNLDVAQALRSDGWNVVFFHYRGAWGSEGDYSLLGSEHDVQSVIDYLRNPAHASQLRVDPDRIVTVGHSLGGHMAIAGLLNNKTVTCAISYDGANLGAGQGKGLFKDPRVGKLWREYSDTLFMLNEWSGEKAVAEMEQHGLSLDLVARAASAGQRPILLIAADTKVIPIDVHIRPLFEALQAVTGSRAEYVLIDDDHSFSASRDRLIKTTKEFLNENCR